MVAIKMRRKIIKMSKVLLINSDTGNDTMKIELNGVKYKMPSVVAFENSRDEIEKATFETKKEKDAYMHDFLNRMYASVSSSSVNTSERFFVSQNAVNRSLDLTSFDINDVTGKSSDDLSMLLNLSIIAGESVKNAYFAGQDITKPIEQDVIITTALPISEGREKGVIDSYAKRFTSTTHVVNFHNFKDPITVILKFKKIYVGLEGEMAHLAIVNSPKNNPALAKSMEEDLHSHYPNLRNIKANDIAKVPNAISINIGGKTTDFAVIVNGRVNQTLSDSMITGYDTVLQEAVDDLTSMNYNFKTIAGLNSYLKQPANPFMPTSKQKVEDVITNRTKAFAKDVISHTSKTIRRAGGNIQLVLIHGGGSVPMNEKSNMRAELADKLRHFNGGDDVPIIWIDKKYAQDLDMDGLGLILQVINQKSGD